MGAVAELYKDFGGLVFFMGKPSIKIYKKLQKILKKLIKKECLQ